MRALSELTGEFVVYRNLQPFDPRVPGVTEAWREMGLAGPGIVRKREPGYAQAAAWILRRFHDLSAANVAPSELLLIGDTLGNDGGAFRALAQATGWQGSAFIGTDDLTHPLAANWQHDLYIANRWQALADWLGQLVARGLRLDARTIVIVDIDKTALGARGRNNGPLDSTRLLGMRQTVANALGPNADLDAFAAIYRQLNLPAYKELTADNQDFLAYICTMVGAGVLPLADLKAAYASGAIDHFPAFLNHIHSRGASLPDSLRAIHETVYAAVSAGDPTPFKGFRRQEYLAAVTRMGNLPDDAPLAERLQTEICLTQEVWDACTWLQSRGALITALSDKPDEACAPTPELAAQGFRPIHSTPTHLVGHSLALADLG